MKIEVNSNNWFNYIFVSLKFKLITFDYLKIKILFWSLEIKIKSILIQSLTFI